MVKKRKKLFDKIYFYLTKHKVFASCVIIIMLIASVYTLYPKKDTKDGDNNININIQQIRSDNNGNIEININQKVDEVPQCPECPVMDYHPMELHHEIKISCDVCEGFENVEIDLNKVRFNFADSSIFVDKLPYDEKTTVGLCNYDGSFCYIFPQYKFDKNDDVCIVINVSKSGKWNISHLQKPSEERKCLTLHDTNIIPGKITSMGIINNFRVPLQTKDGTSEVHANYYKMKIKIPTNQSIFFNEFLSNQTITYGFCTPDRKECYIKPEYRLDEKDEVCVEATLSDDWCASGLTILATENRSSCVQEVETKKFFSELEECACN